MFLGVDNGFYRFNGFNRFSGFSGKGGGFAAFFEGAMPEDLRITSFPFPMSDTICFAASDKDPSATLGMTIKEKR